MTGSEEIWGEEGRARRRKREERRGARRREERRARRRNILSHETRGEALRSHPAAASLLCVRFPTDPSLVLIFLQTLLFGKYVLNLLIYVFIIYLFFILILKLQSYITSRKSFYGFPSIVQGNAVSI
jgi:hypothetical protein